MNYSGAENVSSLNFKYDSDSVDLDCIIQQ